MKKFLFFIVLISFTTSKVNAQCAELEFGFNRNVGYLNSDNQILVAQVNVYNVGSCDITNSFSIGFYLSEDLDLDASIDYLVWTGSAQTPLMQAVA